MVQPQRLGALDEPGNRAAKITIYAAIILGVSYVFWGRDGSLQWLLPFPQEQLTEAARPQRG